MGRKALARSNTATEKPKLASPWAAHSPPGPAPIMAISKVGVSVMNCVDRFRTCLYGLALKRGDSSPIGRPSS